MHEGASEGGQAASRTTGGRPSLTRRFYQEALVQEDEGGFLIALDGRPVRTPGRKALRLPGRSLAEAVRSEWSAQTDVIDPATMPLTRLANTTLDGVADSMEPVREDVARYARSDLVCYRAGEPDRLVAAQSGAWDPVLAWARDALGAHFILSLGVMFVQQPETTLARIDAALAEERSPFALAGLHVMTTLTGSLLIALMHAAGALDEEAAWRAAHVDEIHQESLWGEDHEAAMRREARRAEFVAASRFLSLSRAG